MHAPASAADAGGVRVSKLRWAILAMLFAATVLNYVDRQTLSILASQVQKDLGIDDLGYARIVQSFLIAYALSYLGAGWVTDKLGAKLTLALFLGWWSLANMATGWVRNAAQLGFARLMLGIGEPGVYTAGPKAVAEHFPLQERGFAIGVYTAGAMIGATIAPPLIAWLSLQYGWRAAFVVTGAAGFVWLAVWLLVYRSPDGAEPARTKEPIRWGPILRDRRVWGLAVARMIADPVWYFYLFWFPKYLTDERGMGLMQVASVAWIVYLAADVGSIGGGWFSGRLIRAGIAPARSRLIAMTCAAAVAPIGMLISLQFGIAPTIALGALVALRAPRFPDQHRRAGRRPVPDALHGDGVRPDRGGQRARRFAIDPARRSAREHACLWRNLPADGHAAPTRPGGSLGFAQRPKE